MLDAGCSIRPPARVRGSGCMDHQPCDLRGKGASTGGAWHPDSQRRLTGCTKHRRIGVPGILTSRAMKAQPLGASRAPAPSTLFQNSRTRQREHKPGADRVFGIELELSALSLREAAGDGEAETEPRSTHRVFGAVKGSKHSAPLAAWYARTVVRHLDPQPVVISFHPHPDPTILRRAGVFLGVVQQIIENLTKRVGVEEGWR